MEKTLADAIAFFDKATASLKTKKKDVVPLGFFSARQFAEAKTPPRSTDGMRVDLDRMVMAGLAEVKQFRVGHCLTKYYRIFPVCEHTYSRAMNQPRPRLCIKCKKPEAK